MIFQELPNVIIYNPKEGHKRITAVYSALSLLIGLAAFNLTPAHAAGRLTGADAYAAPWIKDIEHELPHKDYATVCASDPLTPQAAVLRKLNDATTAQEAEDTTLAKQFVRDALSVFEEGAMICEGPHPL